MKKTVTLITVLAGAVSGYSQGIVSFSDYNGAQQQQVFNTQANPVTGATLTSVTFGGYTVNEYVGSTANAAELPSGSAVFAGAGLSGTQFDAQLLAAAGTGLPISSLVAQGSILHFYTTAALLGFVKGTAAVTLTSGAVPTTIAFAAWTVNSAGVAGAATTLAMAQADEQAGDAGYAWGVSTTQTVTPNTSLPLALTGGMEGFSLGTVPEPSTIALGVMGASALLFRRRK